MARRCPVLQERLWRLPWDWGLRERDYRNEAETWPDSNLQRKFKTKPKTNTKATPDPDQDPGAGLSRYGLGDDGPGHVLAPSKAKAYCRQVVACGLVADCSGQLLWPDAGKLASCSGDGG